jgi:hypothetical protein
VTEYAVLIAASDLLPSLKPRFAGDASEIAAFADTEALRALEVITTRRPGLVLLERKFASTTRGSALINRIKADPSLSGTEIRVVPPESDTDAPAPAAKGSPEAAPPLPPQGLDYRGTRRAPRHRIAAGTEIQIDGGRGLLVDLSLIGAQLIMPSVLKPNQRVRVTLTDAAGAVRCNATVAWAAYEIPRGGPRYRVGLEFVDADPMAVEAFIGRHKHA